MARADFKTRAEILSEQTGIPVGLCQCGCGKETGIACIGSRKDGNVAGKPRAFCKGHKVAAHLRKPCAVCGVIQYVSHGYCRDHRPGTTIKAKMGEVRERSRGRVYIKAPNHPCASRGWVALAKYQYPGAMPADRINKDSVITNGRLTAAACLCGCETIVVSHTNEKRQYLNRQHFYTARTKPRKQCSIIGCNRQHCAHGLCKLHYYRVQRAGYPGQASPLRSNVARPCMVDGCPAKARAKGLCNTHYSRLWKCGQVGPAGSYHPNQQTRRFLPHNLYTREGNVQLESH